jgi:hypothetical protein
MKFKLQREHGALNSPPIFDAIERGLKQLGHTIVTVNPDVEILWSALWSGRMAGNQQIFESRKKLGLPTLFIEVGNLVRGKTWRLSIDHINGLGQFANQTDLDHRRPQRLGLVLKEFQEKRRDHILIACQHAKSLQWQHMPSMEQWIRDTVGRIRQHSDRPVIVRPHPRCVFRMQSPEIKMENPRKIDGSYDDFNIDYNYHCVINHNSGPAVQAAISGVPVICDYTSLAAPVSMDYSQLATPVLPDRTDWFIKLCHTEWTVSEIEQGLPFLRLDTELKKYFS